MKERISLAVIVGLVLVLMSFVAAPVVAANEFVFEDFEDGDVSDWNVGATNGSIAAVTAPISPAGGSYVGKVVFGSSCWGPSKKKDPVSPDYISLYFRADGDTGHPSGAGFWIRGAGTGMLTKISYHSGSLRYEDSLNPYNSIMPASTGTWYQIELRNIDWVGNTYDIWVDGVKKVTGASFRNDVDSFRYVIAYACPWVSGPMYLDDIKYGWTNMAPAMTADTSTVVVDEGQPATNSGTVSDLDDDTVTLSASIGAVVDNDDGTWSWSFDTSDGPAESQTVTVTADDGRDGIGTATFSLTVDNVAPSVGQISAPVDPVAINTAINTTADFTDPGVVDTHTAVWDWGDGTTSTVAPSNGSVSGSHTYAAAGVYTLKVTVTDKDGGSGNSTYQYIVVYDSSAGFVTGGGWINSPSGAYTPDNLEDIDFTGKATFGFVSKYKKGTTIPDGNAQFQFKAGDLNFHSSDYDWLVIAGNKAKFKGTGTINGEGLYGFMITAVDGTSDSFRIKIWDKLTNETMYDNKAGTSDVDYDATELGGGSVVVHKK